MTLRAFRYRFYPNYEQESLLRRTLGCVRHPPNPPWEGGRRGDMEARSHAWKERQEKVGYPETSKMLTQWKQEEALQFLTEVSAVPLQQGLRHLDRGYSHFFAGRAKYPHFKKKRNGGSAASPITKGGNGGCLRRAQKSLSRKMKGSRNREKARRKVAKIHEQIKNARSDCLHKRCKPAPSHGETSAVLGSPQVEQLANPKGARERAPRELTTRLVRENQTIVVEDLSVKGMVRNHKLAKHISDCAWGEFVKQLDYKCQWYGRTLVKVDKWFPSSKLCSSCGHQADSMPLEVREWTCPKCGTVHDRDLNAAQNLLAVGHTVTACGASVRLEGLVPESNCEKPVRERSRNLNREVWESPSFQGGEDVKDKEGASATPARPRDLQLRTSEQPSYVECY